MSFVLVAIVLISGWITDRPHFFDDGGPLGVLLVIEVSLGLSAALLGAVFSGVASSAVGVAAKLRTGQIA